MVLGIDFGVKRVGVAISNPSNNMALALTTFSSKQSLDLIKELIIKKNIDTIVIGYPIKDDKDEGFIGRQARLFSKQLETNTNITVILVNEFLSTQLSIKHLREQGYSKKSIEEKKDSEAARIILQTYLDNNLSNLFKVL